MNYSAYVLPDRNWSDAKIARIMPKERDSTTKPTFVPLEAHARSKIIDLTKPDGITDLRGDYPSGVVLLINPMRMVEVRLKGPLEVDYGMMANPLRITGGRIKRPLSVLGGSIVGPLEAEDVNIAFTLDKEVQVPEELLEIIPISSAILPLYWIDPDQTILEIDPDEVEQGIVVLFRPFETLQSQGT